MHRVHMYSFGSDPLQTYAQVGSGSRAVVFVHGGAWRDPDNTYRDWEAFAGWMTPGTAPVLSTNYRLVPHQHPAHLEDLLHMLCDARTRLGVEEVSLVGHSVGATMALQVLNWEALVPGMDDSTKAFLKAGLPRVEAVALLDGIYHMDAYYQEFPQWKPYFAEAFAEEPNRCTQLDYELPVSTTARVLILHSNADELVSPQQSTLLQAYLQKCAVPCTLVVDNYGEHNQVYQLQAVAAVVDSWVQRRGS